MRVTDPQGAKWKVGRRWLPWRLRRRRVRPDIWDMDFLDDFVGLALAIVFFVATLLLLPFVVLALELVVLVVGGLGMIVARTVFGYPWLVDARKRRSREIIEWEVDGYARSGEVVGEVAAALAQGQTDIRPQGAKEVAHLRDEATDAAALG